MIIFHLFANYFGNSCCAIIISSLHILSCSIVVVRYFLKNSRMDSGESRCFGKEILFERQNYGSRPVTPANLVPNSRSIEIFGPAANCNSVDCYCGNVQLGSILVCYKVFRISLRKIRFLLVALA